MRTQNENELPSVDLSTAAPDAFVWTAIPIVPASLSATELTELYQQVYEAARERVIAAEAKVRFDRRNKLFLN